MNDDSNNGDSDDSSSLGSAPDDVMDIDETAKSVGLRSGQEDDEHPQELDTNKDLTDDEKNDWQS